MMLKRRIQLNLLLSGLICLSISFPLSAFSDWQQSAQGTEYKLEGITDEEKQKAKEALDSWQKQTTQFFRTLQALDISYDELIYTQKAYSKTEFGLVYRYDANSSSTLGVRVIAVSPLSFMQNIGVKNGDIIQRINGISLVNNLEKNDRGQLVAAVRLTEILKSLKETDPITLNVLRKKESIVLNGRVTSLHIPELKMVAKPPIRMEVDGSNCAILSILDYDSPKKALFKVQLLSINDEDQRNFTSVKLKPGKYNVEIRENILDRRLSTRIPLPYRIKTIEVTARPGRLYTLAAELQEDEVRNREKFWEAKVTEREVTCTMD